VEVVKLMLGSVVSGPSSLSMRTVRVTFLNPSKAAVIVNSAVSLASSMSPVVPLGMALPAGRLNKSMGGAGVAVEMVVYLLVFLPFVDVRLNDEFLGLLSVLV